MSMSETVVVVCAMESEAVHLRRMLQHPRETPMHVWRRTAGTIDRIPVAVVVSGIGLINAAAATSAVCTAGRPRAVINYGCSGAHRPDIECGDVVLGEWVVHLSSLIVDPEGQQQYQGFRYRAGDEEVLAESIPGDPDLLALAQRAADGLDLPVWPGSEHPPVVHTGTVGSADIWTQHGESIQAIHGLHGSLCEEMEAAAVAQVCAIFGVPFLAVKDISNNELQVASDLSDQTQILGHVEDELGRRAALAVEALIRSMEPDTGGP